ncbi:MAG TPA: trehalase family glycosidase, partial [Acidobacteriaceae bacterium]
MPRSRWVWIAVVVVGLVFAGFSLHAQSPRETTTPVMSRNAGEQAEAGARSAEYAKVQERLARGWNTWDVHSVATQVLMPDGLAIHVGLKHNTTEGGDAFLGDALIGRLNKGAEVVTPGPHSWDGSYTELRVEWMGHRWRVQSAHEGDDLVLLVTPIANEKTSALPPTVVFSSDYLWNRPAAAIRKQGVIEAGSSGRMIPIFCTCEGAQAGTPGAALDVPMGGAYFFADLVGPLGVSTGKRRTVAEIEAAIARQKSAYEKGVSEAGKNGPIYDAIETTLGWDTIYEPSKGRVVSPVSRVWSVGWGGYVIFDWDTFFAATMAGIGDKDLAYADAMETLRELTPAGFVPNYARPGGWKSFDRSEPPVGAITVLGLYEKFHERWFLGDAFAPLLRWNRWWSEHRDMQGYLAWGSDGQNRPANLDDNSVGTRAGAILESGLDNSPMYDATTYDEKTHLLEYADVGLMSMYIADCDALARIAEVLGKTAETKELKERGERYRAKLATLWNEKAGIFLNKDLHTGEANMRLSPTNFYPMLAKAATAEEAKTMVEKHLLNPKEFWGEWVIPSIAFDDPAFKDQDYWRGRIWGPMNYLVYLGLANYGDGAVRKDFAEKSYALFLKEWKEKGHVHENY